MDLYNSSFDLYLLGSSGIYSRTIFANRAVEFSNLKQLSLLTVLSLEARDFFASRIEELFILLVRVYVLRLVLYLVNFWVYFGEGLLKD